MEEGRGMSLDDFMAMPFESARGVAAHRHGLGAGAGAHLLLLEGEAGAHAGGIGFGGGVGGWGGGTRRLGSLRGLPTDPGAPVSVRGGAEGSDPTALSYEALLALDDDVVTRGLSASEMHRLERVRATGDEEGTCAPCMEAFQAGAPLLRLPCKHLYHRDCIAKWLENHRTCPTCRARLFDDDAPAQAAPQARPQARPHATTRRASPPGQPGDGRRRARFTMLR